MSQRRWGCAPGLSGKRPSYRTAEWTISRFAGLYQMRYEGMVTNAAEARAAAARV